jgi:flagellar hook assembly protein FlgD
LEKSEPVVFGSSPAEIYVTFADGAGRYQLEIVDTLAHPVKVVYDRHISAKTSAWVEWDGKDGQGKEMPPGHYFVIFFKDGKPLRSISIVRAELIP